ncbi:hypothetical protein ACFQ0O_13620 [Saccharopolyspora spinosporotrichia]
MTRLLLVYHSRTGTHRRLAEWAARSAERRGAEVRVRQVPALPGMPSVTPASPWPSSTICGGRRR